METKTSAAKAPVTAAPVATSAKAEKAAVVPFNIKKDPDFKANEAFVKTITSEKGKASHRSYYLRFRSMTIGIENWLEISDKKYANLNKMRLAHEANPVDETPALKVVAEKPAKAEKKADKAPVAEAKSADNLVG